MYPTTPAISAEANWLVGKWEMTYDPDGDEKDWVEFNGNGEVKEIYEFEQGGKRSKGTKNRATTFSPIPKFSFPSPPFDRYHFRNPPKSESSEEARKSEDSRVT